MADYRAIAAAAARKYGIDPRVFLAQINQESGFNPNARSGAGALGIAQIVPRWHPGVNPMNPAEALDYAARMDAQNLKKYGGSWKDVLSVYNSGRPFSVGQGISETANYVKNILGAAGAASAPAAPSVGVGSASLPTPTGAPAAPHMALDRNLLTQFILRQGTHGLAAALPSMYSMVAQQAAPAVAGMAAPAAQQVTSAVRGLVNPLSTPLGSDSYNTPDGPEGVPTANGGHIHGALDWFAPGGSPVRAPISGTVVEAKPSRGNTGQVFGGTVKVQGPDGRVYVFRHVDPNVAVGARVGAGSQIARVTKWAGGASHAHTEVWKSLAGGYNAANLLDPYKVFGGR